MKRFIQSAQKWTALACITLAVSACGSRNGDSNSTNTNGGAPGIVYNGGVASIPGGAAQISFSGSNVYLSSIYLQGGMTGSGNGTCSLQYCYCGLFQTSSAIDQSGRYYTGGYSGGYNPYNTAGGVPSCWQFGNVRNSQYYYPYTSGTGTVTVGSYGLPVGTQGSSTFTATSAVDPGTSLTLVASPTGEVNHANVIGNLTISPYSMARNFPNGLQIQSIAFDLALDQSQAGASTRRVTGGLLIFHSAGVAFLAL